ncbi:MAG: hypothetical protein R3B47_01280 [Bacteroidia bacterium]
MHTSDSHNDLPHRADELQDAPKLQALRSQLRQDAPEGYFAGFRERLADRLEDEKVLEQAPKLMEIGNEGRPEVPNGYFEAFPKRLMNTIAPAPVRSLWQRPMVWAVAAGIALLCAFGLMYQPADQGPASDAIAKAGEVIDEMEDQELLAMLSLAGAEAEDVASVFSVEEIGFQDLEGFEEESDAEALLESLDLSENDILDLINETYQ